MAKNRKLVEVKDVERTARRFRMLLLISGLTLAVGTTVFHYVEEWSWVDAFYFSAVSLTTVGYGDLAPETDLGKVLVVIYLIIGIGIIAALINNFVQGVAARQQLNDRNRKE